MDLNYRFPVGATRLEKQAYFRERARIDMSTPGWKPRSKKDMKRVRDFVLERQNNQCNCCKEMFFLEEPYLINNFKTIWNIDNLEFRCYNCATLVKSNVPRKKPHEGKTKLNPRKRLILKRILSERQNHRCCYCGIQVVINEKLSRSQKVPKNYATFDHILPKSQNGLWDEDNLVIACSRCNGERGNMSAMAFYEKKMLTQLNTG